MCETNIRLTKKKTVVGYKLVSTYKGDYLGYYSYIKLNTGKVPRLSKKIIDSTRRYNAMAAFAPKHVGKITIYKRLKDIKEKMESNDVGVVRVKASGRIWSGKDGSGVTGIYRAANDIERAADCYLVEYIDEIRLVKKQEWFPRERGINEVGKILEIAKDKRHTS